MRVAVDEYELVEPRLRQPYYSIRFNECYSLTAHVSDDHARKTDTLSDDTSFIDTTQNKSNASTNYLE